MFHWICPECGQEIAPAEKECPACDPVHTAETATPAETIEAAVTADQTRESVVETARPGEIIPAPTVEPTAETAASAPPEASIDSGKELPAVGASEEAATQQEAAPQAEESESATPVAKVSEPPDASTEQPHIATNAVSEIAQEATSAETSEETPEWVAELQAEAGEKVRNDASSVSEPVGGTTDVKATEVPSVATEEPSLVAAAEPTTEAATQDEEVAAEAPAVSSEPVIASTEVKEAAAEETPAPSEEETFAGRLAALAEQLQAGHIPYVRPESTAPQIAAPPAAPLPTIEPQVASKVALLTAPPVVALLAEPAPPQIATDLYSLDQITPQAATSDWNLQGQAGAQPWGPLAAPLGVSSTLGPEAGPIWGGMTDYPAAAARITRPAVPTKNVIATGATMHSTLPGPALPRELNSLQAAGLVPVTTERGAPTTKSIPVWIVSFLVMTTLLSIAFGAVFYAMPGLGASTTNATPTPEPPPVVQEPPHPASALVEVTGFRFQLDPTKKPEIHYLVVNHAGTPLASMNVFVSLRAANAKAGQPPLYRFVFRTPKLAPFEFKDMATAIDKTPKPNIPDWQDLRADVEIGQ